MVDIKQLVKRSSKATCGVFEREVSVRASEVRKALSGLEREGYKIVGKSIGPSPRTKIWFIRKGFNL